MRKGNARFGKRDMGYVQTLNSLVLGLFSNGEPGFWLDPSDLSTMYQDSAGTTPVTAVEQPVGLILDKSKGLVLGAELITAAADRNFTSDTGFWTKGAGTTIGSGLCTFTAVVNGAGLTRAGFLTVGAVYQVTYTLVSLTSGSVGTYVGGSRTTSRTVPGTYTEIVCATGDAYIGFNGASANTTATITNISVKQIAGTHYYQSTAGVRPVLSARVNLLTKTEALDSAPWSAANAAVSGTKQLAPDGTLTAQLLVESSSNSAHSISQASISTPSLGAQAHVIYVKSSGRRWLAVQLSGGTPTAYAYFDLQSGVVGTTSGTPNASIVASTNGFWKITIAPSATALTTNTLAYYMASADNTASYQGDGTSGVIFWHPDLRPSDQATGLIPTYQRVNTSTDYDTAGFPLYLSGNGTQWMQCAAQDYTGVNKIMICGGIRKTVNAVTYIFEFSTDYSSSAGAFAIAQTADWYFGSRGATTYQFVTQATGLPQTAVLTGTSDLTAPLVSLRRNGSSVGTTSGSQGGGNFGNYPAYLFSRAGTSLFFTGNLFGLVARGSAAASSAAQISATEAYMNGKAKCY